MGVLKIEQHLSHELLRDLRRSLGMTDGIGESTGVNITLRRGVPLYLRIDDLAATGVFTFSSSSMTVLTLEDFVGVEGDTKFTVSSINLMSLSSIWNATLFFDVAFPRFSDGGGFIALGSFGVASTTADEFKLRRVNRADGVLGEANNVGSTWIFFFAWEVETVARRLFRDVGEANNVGSIWIFFFVWEVKTVARRLFRDVLGRGDLKNKKKMVM